MRIGFIVTAVFALTSAASAAERDRPTAIVVSPIHEAQVVRGDDGMDHVEYELLVVSVFPEPITLTSVTVLNPAGKQLMRVEKAALSAAPVSHTTIRRSRVNSGRNTATSAVTGDRSQRRYHP
jgi:hypothetical protein